MDIVPIELIQRKILLIRGRKVMIDRDLAELYEVETRALNQAVKRNISRFPDDFMFHLTPDEAEWLVSQNVIPHKKYLGGSLPNAFTENGVAMLSSVLNSEGLGFILHLLMLIEQNFPLAPYLAQGRNQTFVFTFQRSIIS